MECEIILSPPPRRAVSTVVGIDQHRTPITKFFPESSGHNGEGGVLHICEKLRSTTLLLNDRSRPKSRDG